MGFILLEPSLAGIGAKIRGLKRRIAGVGGERCSDGSAVECLLFL